MGPLRAGLGYSARHTNDMMPLSPTDPFYFNEINTSPEKSETTIETDLNSRHGTDGNTIKEIKEQFLILSNMSISEAGAYKAVSALRTHSQSDPTGILITNLSGIKPIVWTMHNFSESSIIQKTSCGALQNLSCSDKGQKAMVVEGGIGAVLMAMRLHPDCCKVQQYATAVLRNMAAYEKTNRDIIARDGGILTILSSMLTCQKYAQMQENACAALGNLMIKNRKNVKIAEQGDAFRIITVAMLWHSESVGVQEKGCFALSQLTCADRNVQLLQEEDAKYFVEKAMRSFPERCERYGQSFLRRLQLSSL